MSNGTCANRIQTPISRSETQAITPPAPERMNKVMIQRLLFMRAEISEKTPGITSILENNVSYLTRNTLCIRTHRSAILLEPFFVGIADFYR